MSLEKKGPWKSGNWASQIETNSYDTVLFGPPIWMDPLIKLHFYVDDEIDSPSEPIKLPTPDLSDLPRFRLLEVRRELSKPYGSKAEVFPSLRDSQFVENDMTDAMTDIGTPGSLTPVWRKEGVSFDDALVVDEEPLLSPTNQLSESVQFGYLNKLSSKFKQ
ncbi:hypothetical protein BC830DRAFT_673870 [Chytriomyces sp. MP71]|nr:hypothetical protein BC830DRAFT_673870 [Chytriomyces sp. MP71]